MVKFRDDLKIGQIRFNHRNLWVSYDYITGMTESELRNFMNCLEFGIRDTVDNKKITVPKEKREYILKNYIETYDSNIVYPDCNIGMTNFQKPAYKKDIISAVVNLDM